MDHPIVFSFSLTETEITIQLKSVKAINKQRVTFKKATLKNKKIEVLWASTRETYNIFEAQKIKCHIITVPHSLLNKFSFIGMNLKKLSLSTVKSFLSDSIKAGFKIKI